MSAPGDLATLAELKRWLTITTSDDDDVLAALLTATSRAIGSILGRASLLPTFGTEVIDGRGETALMLRRWPVLGVTSVAVDGQDILPAVGGDRRTGYVIDAPDPAPPGRKGRLALRGAVFRPGIGNVEIAYTAGYGVVGELATVPSVPPFSVAAAAPYGTWASDGGVAYDAGGALTASAGVLAAGQYAVEGGIYTFAAADAGATVRLSYGYVPIDLARACLDWAADRYSARGRIGQASRSLGGQETTSFIVKDMPAVVATALQPYREVVG